MSILIKIFDLFFKGITLLTGILFLIGGGFCFIPYAIELLHHPSEIFTYYINFTAFISMLILVILIPLFSMSLGWFLIKSVLINLKENNNDEQNNPQDKTNEP
jgi:hypothetical protein